MSAVAHGSSALLLAFLAACSDDAVGIAPVPVASVRLTPLTVVIEQGATRRLDAVAVDADGNPLFGRVIKWSTDNPGVATVSAVGLVQALAPGYAVIIASVEGKSASSAFTVTERDPEPAEFDLVFERRAFNGDGEIRRLSPTTGTSTTIPLTVPIPGGAVRDATPSPDGTRIAFTVAWYPDASPFLDGDVYVANIDGSSMRRLTTEAGLDDQPAWPPDGTRIAFRSKRSDQGDIWIIGADGTGERNRTSDNLPATSNEHSAAWSPDGTRIAYASDIDAFPHVKLWTMRPDGGDKQRVLPATVGMDVVDMEPSWSPHSRRIAFRRGSSSGSEIMIATLETHAVTAMQLNGVQTSPAWSPDGALIAFSSTHQNPMGDIYTMRPDSTEITRRTNGGSEYWSPRWLRAGPRG